jgi:hypothetical protein
VSERPSLEILKCFSAKLKGILIITFQEEGISLEIFDTTNCFENYNEEKPAQEFSVK